MGLHATIGTVEAVEDFVRKHDGAWPRSWGELEQTSPQIRDAYGFTDGRAKIEEFVSIDFNANPDQLMKQSEEEFDAIKPVGPSYGSYRYHLPSLLAALRETRRPHSIDSSHPGSGRR